MRLLRKLNTSYQKVFRNRHIAARALLLSDEEYRLWDLYIALYDWDKNHEETYGTVKATDEEIAEILLWSPSKTCRVRNKLIGKKVITQLDRSEYKISPTLESSTLATMQEKIPQTQNKSSFLKEKIAPMQENQSKNEEKSIVSYKDEYKYVMLTEEDKEWINRNVYE